MMNTQDYLKKWKQVRLSDTSRVRIEENLLSYARFHGVRAGEVGRSIGVPGTALEKLVFKPNSKSMVAIALIVALFVGGGTSYAAEGAIPGDMLYPVKIGVNENIKSAFAVSNEAEAELQAHLAAERLREAETLAVRGELSAEESANIAARITHHYEEAIERSDKAEANGEYDTSAAVRASLEGSFRTYAEVLAGLNSRVAGNSGGALISQVRTYANAAAEAQTHATATIETSASVKASVGGTVSRAETLITNVQSKLAQAKGQVSADVYAGAEARLNQAVAVHAEASASLRAEAYRVSYELAQRAIRIAHEVEALIDSALRLNVNVKTTVGSSITNVLNSTVGTESDTNTQTGMETESGQNTLTEGRDSTNSGTGTQGGGAIDINVKGTTETNIDTEIIDTGVRTETSGGIKVGI